MDAVSWEAHRHIRLFEAAYGPDHPDVATVLDNLAGTLRELGELATAPTGSPHAPVCAG